MSDSFHSCLKYEKFVFLWLRCMMVNLKLQLIVRNHDTML